MMGVAPLQAGRGSFQVTFSSADHLTGKPVSEVVELRFGPRHCGQFSARTNRARSTRAAAVLIRSRIQQHAELIRDTEISQYGARVRCLGVRLMRNPDFLKLWTGQTISQI